MSFLLDHHQDTDPELAMALLQHYGLATHFVDLTSDPRIAAWFALNEYSDSQPFYIGSSMRMFRSASFRPYLKRRVAQTGMPCTGQSICVLDASLFPNPSRLTGHVLLSSPAGLASSRPTTTPRRALPNEVVFSRRRWTSEQREPLSMTSCL